MQLATACTELPRRQLRRQLRDGNATATGCFLLATQSGYLTVTSILASLYPAITVVLAATVLRERVHRGQAVGLVLCGAAVALVAGG